MPGRPARLPPPPLLHPLRQARLQSQLRPEAARRVVKPASVPRPLLELSPVRAPRSVAAAAVPRPATVPRLFVEPLTAVGPPWAAGQAAASIARRPPAAGLSRVAETPAAAAPAVGPGVETRPAVGQAAALLLLAAPPLARRAGAPASCSAGWTQGRTPQPETAARSP